MRDVHFSRIVSWIAAWLMSLASGASGAEVIRTAAGGGPNNLPALAANLDSPSSVAVDAVGNLFIAARQQHRIFKVDRSRQLTVVAVDAEDNLFIADEWVSRIRRVDATTGIITTVAGNAVPGFGGDGDLAASARLQGPAGVAFNALGDLFIADRGNSRIRRVDAATGIITTVAGSGVGGSSGFIGDGGPATSARLGAPRGIALGEAGILWIADSGNDRIRLVGDEILATDIDLKPGSIPNSINPMEQGVVPVATLGSENFDASEIGGASLRSARGAAVPAHDLADPIVFADHLEDVNGDGRTDLVSHYSIEETGIAYGDMTACLSGSTLDGVQFNGCDAVRTVPDLDGDRLPDVDEQAAGTNAFYRDSDNDGYDDGTEVLALRTDPLDALDPAPAPVEQNKSSRVRNRRR